MLFNWFDHPLIEGWREARLRAELQREQAAAPEDGGFQRLEVFRVEAAPNVAREPVERLAVHPLHEPAPAGDDNRRRRRLANVRRRQDWSRNVIDRQSRRGSMAHD